MSKARPKRFVIYRIASFDGQAECHIYCYPQQKWEYSIDGNKVELSRKEVDMYIPKEYFDLHWKVVE